MRGKAVAAVAGGMLALAIGLTLFSAWRAEQATRPQTVCTLKFDVATLDNVPQVTTIPQMARGLSGLADVGPGLLFTWADDAPRVFLDEGHADAAFGRVHRRAGRGAPDRGYGALQRVYALVADAGP